MVNFVFHLVKYGVKFDICIDLQLKKNYKLFKILNK